MGKSKNLPDYVLTVREYAKLQEYARAFAKGYLNLLLLFGPPGIGKSNCIRQAVAGDVCWIDGNATAFGIYMAAYEHRNLPLVLDDVDGLYHERQGLRLLKSLCQTDPLKHVSWQTNAPALDREGIPRQFMTSSRVAIIANRWQSLNADVAALEDRGHVLYFNPTPVEVHRQAALWFWDQGVFDFVADHLHLVEQPSFRVYQLAWELKKAGLDWKLAVLSRCLQGTALEVAKLRFDATFSSEENRARAFVEAGHGCRATYFNHAKKLRSPEFVPKIVLTNKEPQLLAEEKFDLLALLQQRFGRLGNG